MLMKGIKKTFQGKNLPIKVIFQFSSVKKKIDIKFFPSNLFLVMFECKSRNFLSFFARSLSVHSRHDIKNYNIAHRGAEFKLGVTSDRERNW